MENELVWYLLYVLMPLAAFLYASVGHGGASSYLMLLTLAGVAPAQIRPTALLLNLCVSFIAFLSYRKASVFPVRLFVWLTLFSVPAAYIGGTLSVEGSLYRQLLGLMLLFPALRFLNVFPVREPEGRTPHWVALALSGASIGLVSGLIGIGGGIVLSPLLLMLGWAETKPVAALSALFIFVNSMAGYVGMKGWEVGWEPQLWAIWPLTLAAGLAGAYTGAFRWNVRVVRYALAIVLLVAASKLLLK